MTVASGSADDFGFFLTPEQARALSELAEKMRPAAEMAAQIAANMQPYLKDMQATASIVRQMTQDMNLQAIHLRQKAAFDAIVASFRNVPATIEFRVPTVDELNAAGTQLAELD